MICSRDAGICVVVADFLAEAFQPVAQHQAFRPRVFAPRHGHHVLDDLPDAIAVVAHDLGEPLVLFRQGCGFSEQLRRMTHGAHGIADLMGDARGKPAEPGQFGLLDLGGQEVRVFEENDDRQKVPHHRAARSAAG